MYQGLGSRACPWYPPTARISHGPPRKHGALMRLWPIVWAQERLPPAWVATSLLRPLFEESIHPPWQMGWMIVLSSDRPEGLMVLGEQHCCSFRGSRTVCWSLLQEGEKVGSVQMSIS